MLTKEQEAIQIFKNCIEQIQSLGLDPIVIYEDSDEGESWIWLDDVTETGSFGKLSFEELESI